MKEQEAINKRADEEQTAERASLLAQVADANRKRAAAESALQQLGAQNGGKVAATVPVVVDDSHLVMTEQVRALLLFYFEVSDEISLDLMCIK